MNSSGDPATRPSFARPHYPLLSAVGGGAMLALLLAGFYADRRERALTAESWEREAERLTAVYATLPPDAPDASAEARAQRRRNHEDMANLLGPQRRMRPPLTAFQALLMVALGAYAALTLVSGLLGPRARSREAAARPGRDGGDPPGGGSVTDS